MSDRRVTRKVKQGKIDVDFEDSALLVNYDLETVSISDHIISKHLIENLQVQVDENGRVLEVLERKPEVRRIKIKSLSADKNMAQLAADIVDKCKYIHPSRTEEVEQLLLKLRRNAVTSPISSQSSQQSGPTNGANNRGGRDEYDDRDNGGRQAHMPRRDPSIDNDLSNYHGNGGNGHGKDSDRRHHRDDARSERDDMRRSRDETSRKRRDDINFDTPAATKEREREKVPVRSQLDSLPPAHLEDLSDYLDMLYEVSGKTEKEREEALALQQRGTAMILKLCRDVMNLEQLIQNGTVMGALTRVLQEEFKKSVDLTFNILRIFLAFSNFAEMHSIMGTYKIGALTMKAIDYELKRAQVREEEHVQKDKGFAAELAAARDLAGQRSSAEQAEAADRIRKAKDKEAAKYRVVVRKQDKLLFVSFYILLNLAEDLAIEQKMVKKALVHSLTATLGRSFEDLLILCVTFLKKLSIIGENKDEVRDGRVVDLVARFIPCSSQPLVNISLRFLFNLSFDKDLREQMIRCGYVPKLMGLLKTPQFRAKTLKLLYHLSVDDRCKAMIAHTDGGVDLLKGMVINFPADSIAKELGALVVNLTYHPRVVEQVIAHKGLNLLMDRLADKRQDVLLLKIVRNISLWSFSQQQETDTPELDYKYRGLWSPHLKLVMELLREASQETSQDLLVEVLGTLANMTVYDLPASATWAKLLKEHGLMGLFSRMLVPGMVANDLLLEMIMLIASIASDTQAVAVIASSSLIGLLYRVWQDKHDDVEVLLQLLHLFHKLFCHKEAREEAMYSTRVVVDIIDCLAHRNTAVRTTAEKLCDIVLEFDRNERGEPGQLGVEIIRKRFESYNKVWLANNSMVGVSHMGNIANSNNSNHVQNQHLQHQQQQYGEDVGAGDRLRTSYEEEVNMVNSAQYFNDRVDDSMDAWRGNDHHQQQQQQYHQQPYYQQGSPGSEEDAEDSGSYNNFGYK